MGALFLPLLVKESSQPVESLVPSGGFNMRVWHAVLFKFNTSKICLDGEFLWKL